MVDSNDDAYIAYDAWMNDHTISIEKLSFDYRRSVGISSGDISPHGNEAPVYVCVYV